jgi:FemAB-related protein (PEP-CTERM system-associated)
MLTEVSISPPAGWDAYVASHPAGTAYHRAKAVEIGRECFALPVSFVSCRDVNSRLVGILPLVEQSSLLFGRYLTSVPFFTYGGILADGDDAVASLMEGAMSLARSRRADHVELRHSAPLSLSLPERLDKVSMVLDLPDSPEALAKRLGSKLRSQIKRADREQSQVVWGGKEILDEFYAVFSSTMHRLGTPVYPRKFFDIVFDALDRAVSVIVVRAFGRVQAAAIVVQHGRRIEVPWAAATEAAKTASLNMKMYSEMLIQSIRLGAAAFDFGRSTAGSGTYRFKAQWGAKEEQLHWHYWLSEGRDVPKLNHANPRYARAAALWRRMPLWCANLLGPHISRHLP